jgi:DNA-directed RNA polymerase specialized sigma24 family protein
MNPLINSDMVVLEFSIKAWTNTIMKNTFINNYRKGKLFSILRDQEIASSLGNKSKKNIETLNETRRTF